MNSYLSRIILALTSMLILSACGKQMDDFVNASLQPILSNNPTYSISTNAPSYVRIGTGQERVSGSTVEANIVVGSPTAVSQSTTYDALITLNTTFVE